MSEIADIVQIIRIEFEGLQMAIKVGGASMKMVKKTVSFLVSLLQHEKSIGKTNLKKMLLKGGDLQVFQFDREQAKEVKKLCKKYGVLFTEIPPKSKESKRMEILFHSEATPRVNMLIQKLKNPATARIKSVDSFIQETEKEKTEDKERQGERDFFTPKPEREKEQESTRDREMEVEQEMETKRDSEKTREMGRQMSPEIQEKEKEELTIWERYLKQFDDDEKPDLAPPVQMEHPSRTEKRKSR